MMTSALEADSDPTSVAGVALADPTFSRLSRWRQSALFDLPVLLTLAGVFAVFAFWRGGANAAALGWGAWLTAAALGFHVVALASRSDIGFQLHKGSLLFVPWLLWLALDWLFISPLPWHAETGLITHLMIFAVFSLALCHLRDPLLKWGGILAPAAIALALSAISLSGTASAQPAETGAVMLMATFPLLAISGSRRWSHWWLRMPLITAILLFAVAMLHLGHLGTLAGCCVGIFLFGLVLARTGTGMLLFFTIGILGSIALGYAITSNSGKIQSNAGIFQQSPALRAPTGSVAFILPKTSWHTIRNAPLHGAGTGGFSLDFEHSRPTDWTAAPKTPGSLPLALLAEHGILGFLLLFIPIFWILRTAFRACRDTVEDVPLPPALPPPMPLNIRFAAGLFAGLAAALTAFCLDYPGPMPAAACLFAFQGALLLRLVKPATVSIPPAKWQFPAMCLFAFIQSALWLLWVLGPLDAAKYVERADATLNDAGGALPDSNHPAVFFGQGMSAAVLEFGDGYAQTALNACPTNADAWNQQAIIALRRHATATTAQQQRQLAAEALRTAGQAESLAPENFSFHLTCGAAMLAAGKDRQALATLRKAHALAPREATTALLLARALTQQPGSGELARDVLEEAGKWNPRDARIRKQLEGE
ncbi:MAG: hypothetical protein LBV54_02740 [Puniceicoccales bacterium]|jgi:hypothetical protein|nr:hypothetical protein [Puniceicoccales bacterium]